MTSEPPIRTVPPDPHAHHHHGGHAGHDHAAVPSVAPGTAQEALTDPVCGMPVTTTSPHKQEYAGRAVLLLQQQLPGQIQQGTPALYPA